MADRYRVADNVSNTKEIAHFVTSASETTNDNLYVDLPSDPRTRPVLTATEFSNSHKKKSTSFQITSVTVQGSRLGNDAGDDSADDLDESHTEDISSDILDCSKTTDLDNELVSSDNSNANVEEFGISGLVLPTIQPIPVKPTKPNESSVNFSVPLTIGVSPDHFTDVTIEPNVVNTSVTLVTTTTSPPGVTAQVPMVNSMPDHWQHRFKVVKIVSSEPFKRGRWLCMDFTDPPTIHNETKAEVTEASLQPNNEPLPIQNSINILATCEPTDKQNVGVTRVYEFPVNQSLPGSIAVQLNPSQPASQPVYSILVPVSSAAANSVQTPTISTSAAVTGAQTGPSIVAPANCAGQNVAVQTAPVTVITSSAPPATTTNVTTAILPNQTTIPLTNIQPVVGSTTLPSHNVVTQINQASQPTQLASTNNATIPSQEVKHAVVSQMTGNIVSTSNIPIQVTSLPTTDLNITGNVSNTVAESSQPVLAAQKNTLDVTNVAASTVPNSSAISTNQSPLLEMLPDALGTKALQDGEDSESAPAGTSTVAIDNKIEQAMDLVKSHLMFAVREEVDVLKEKITELMEKISQLELENGILKANASQETLSQLPTDGVQVTTQNTQNGQTGPLNLPAGGQLIRPPTNANQTQNNQQTTTS